VRALATGCLCVLALGCGRKVQDAEAELAALKLDEQRLAVQVDAIKAYGATLPAAVEAERTRAARAATALRALQTSAVNRWKGDPKKLAELASKVTLPPSLKEALDTAQASAAGDATERAFEAALKEGRLDAVAASLRYWEDPWLAAQEPEAEPQPPAPAVCKREHRPLTCARIDDDALWCPDAKAAASWAMLLENGELSVGRLGAGERHAVVRRLAPRVWVTRLGEGEQEVLFAHELKGTGRLLAFTTQYQVRVVKEGKRTEVTMLNLDQDPYTEALLLSPDELTYLDPYGPADVKVLRGAQACEALELVVTPVPDEVARRCRQLTAPAADAGSP